MQGDSFSGQKRRRQTRQSGIFRAADLDCAVERLPAANQKFIHFTVDEKDGFVFILEIVNDKLFL